MLQRVIETAQAALPPDASGGEPRSRITVVLGAHAEAVREGVIERLAPPRPRVVFCPDWDDGIAHSLRFGLASLQDSDAVLVMLGDTPFISADDLHRLIDAWQTSPDIPAAAAYEGTVGAPCILPRGVWWEIEHLQGDQGAGAWLRSRNAAGVGVTRVLTCEASRDVDAV
jgi:CTP:molybdopterin cytidylyltransferase MocA